MNTLPNAPLVEVIFELKWSSDSKQEVDKFQIVIGAMSTALSDRYNKPVNLVDDPNIPFNFLLNKPTYRFTNIENAAIFVQIGPGILTVNHVAQNYDWESYSKELRYVVEHFNARYEFSPLKDITLGLKYLDFFDYALEDGNVFDYLKEFFHLTIQSDFLKERPLGINFNTAYKISDSTFKLSINSGKLNDNRTGLIVESDVSNQKKMDVRFNDFEKELNGFHTILSEFFKSLTQGKLYESFKGE